MKDAYIILGPPGSGKSTQAILLAEKLNLFHLSWGKILRSKDFDSYRKHRLKKIVDSEQSEQNERKRSSLIAGIIEEKLASFAKEKTTAVDGVIIDGFPRRKFEAILMVKIFEKHGLRLKVLVNINAPLWSIKAKIKKRFFCPSCGRTYDLMIAPKKLGICDYDSVKLIKERVTDQEIKNEFNQYLEENQETYAFLKEYADSFFSVSGDNDEIATFSNIIYKLKNRFRENYRVYYKQSSAILPTRYGNFMINTYLSQIDYSFHIALIKGNVRSRTGVLTRVHSSCMTGDIFGSLKCDCGQQLHRSMRKIDKEGCGVIIYLLQEGRGINIINKVSAYSLQAGGLDTVEANEKLGFPAEMRQYGIVKDILSDLGVKSIRLLTNNPDKICKLTDLGVAIEEVEKIECKPNAENKKYLSVKRRKMGHKLSFVK